MDFCDGLAGVPSLRGLPLDTMVAAGWEPPSLTTRVSPDFFGCCALGEATRADGAFGLAFEVEEAAGDLTADLGLAPADGLSVGLGDALLLLAAMERPL